jgi:hypothetical protein
MTRDVMQEFEDIAYSCDGEPRSRFETVFRSLPARYSAVEIAALSSFFLGGNMFDEAWALWSHGFCRRDKHAAL